MSAHFISILLIVQLMTIKAQFFNPHLDDTIYLDTIENQVTSQVDEARANLLAEVKLLKNLTEIYTGVKLTDNVIKTLSHLSKKRLPLMTHSHSRISGKYPSKIVKQDEIEGPSELDFVVRVTGIIFKNLLLIPTFLRETLRQNVAKENSTGTMQMTSEKVKQRQLNLVQNAETLMNTSRQVQILELLSLYSDNVNEVNSMSSYNKYSTKKGHLSVEERFQGREMDWNLRHILNGFKDKDIYTGTRDTYHLIHALQQFISYN